MMTLYCDESDDGQTYALAGWFTVPSAWATFEPMWRAMLETIMIPDGSSCRAFHAADIVLRDQITGSPFRGWTFDDERTAFSKAISVIEDKKNAAAILWPVGAAVQIPSAFTWIQRDSIWLMLFAKLFQILTKQFPAQRSIALIFDEKKAIQNNALQLHAKAQKLFNEYVGEEYLSGIAFDDDVNMVPLQAADLLAYEWRKRISDETERPDKAIRMSYKRIRDARNEGALWRYGRALFDEAMKIDPVTGDQTKAYLDAFLARDPTHYD